MKFKTCSALLLAALMAGSLAACGSASAGTSAQTDSAQETINAAFDQNGFGSDGSVAADTLSYTAGSDRFTDRDLDQTPDLTGATEYTVKNNLDIEITAAGVYVLSGTAQNVTVLVDAGDEDKVQLVLDGLTLTNEDSPCIYVKNADKVFVTTTDSENSLSVTGAFTADGDTNTDAVIFSKDDLVLNGVGVLTITSTENGITSKDDLKVTGGTLTIDCAADALEANDAIAVADGTFTITTEKDGLHAENDEDDAQGTVYISGGAFTITAGSDAIQGTAAVQIDGGTFDLTAREGIEAAWVIINDGTIHISASDDGINAARKSSAVSPAVEINGGSLTIVMGQGDTDGIDSNGDLTITGGTVDITGNSPFDYDGTAARTGGTLIVNGEEADEITNQFGGMGPGMGGQRPDFGGADGSTGATPDWEQMPELPDDWDGQMPDFSGDWDGERPEPPDGWDGQRPQGGPFGGRGGTQGSPDAWGYGSSGDYAATAAVTE